MRTAQAHQAKETFKWQFGHFFYSTFSLFTSIRKCWLLVLKNIIDAQSTHKIIVVACFLSDAFQSCSNKKVVRRKKYTENLDKRMKFHE